MMRILQVAFEGEHNRGSHGAVMMDEDVKTTVYLLADEYQPADFRDQLKVLLSEDNHKHIFLVLKKDGYMHISKIPRGES